jgi:hypothetical protein
MIQQVIEMLAQEPWCWHPDQIASLTDWQIEKLYRDPALARKKEWDKQRAEMEERNQSEPSEFPKLSPETVRENMDGTKVYRGGEPSRDSDECPPGDKNSPAVKDWVIRQFMKVGMTRMQAEHKYEWQKDHPVG